MSRAPVIGFAGLTHLGLVSAAAAKSKGFDVIACDPDVDLIGRLRAGELPVNEPDLPELARGLAYTDEVARLGTCDVVYVAPDVATDEAGDSDLTAIGGLLDLVEPVLRGETVLVVLSQVPPGFTRARGRAAGPLFYQVETLIFGRAVERATRPERFIVGCAEPDAPLPEAYRTFLDAFGCPVLAMRYESAELAKISINMCLVGSIAVANTMAGVCEATGADWSEIVPALRLDARIGPKAYLTPGLGIAGGNLERDLATVRRLAAAHGADAGIVDAWLTNSRHRRDWALRTLHAEVLATDPDPLIAVLGLAYKQDTASIRNSPSLDLIAALHPYSLRLYDPLVPASAAGHPRAFAANSALEACEGVDAVVIMTPWAEFSEIDAETLAGRVVIDPYGVLERNVHERYFTLGTRMSSCSNT
jgi:UDPglucose 6-dehydrogenase